MENFDLRKFLAENKLTANSVNEYSDEEEGSGYSYEEYKEGKGASEEDIQRDIAHFRKNPLIWKMQAKKDFERMAAGEAADVKNEHYPEWKKEDFAKVLEALTDLNETKTMNNFDLKKFLAENKLTENSKELAEYDMTKTGESEKYEVIVTDANGKKSYQKLSADGMNHYLKMTKFPVTIEFKSKSTTPDFDITGVEADIAVNRG